MRLGNSRLRSFRSFSSSFMLRGNRGVLLSVYFPSLPLESEWDTFPLFFGHSILTWAHTKGSISSIRSEVNKLNA